MEIIKSSDIVKSFAMSFAEIKFKRKVRRKKGERTKDANVMLTDSIKF